MSESCMLCPMYIGHEPRLSVASGGAFAALLGLAAASARSRSDIPPELAAALDDAGDTEGETWLNLLGIPLDAGPPFTTERLLDELRSLEAIELRRHMLGRFAWSWCSLAGADDIEAAARGDAAAARRLLEHPRYYGGHAAASLGVLIGLEPEETRGRILRAVEAFADGIDPARLDDLEQAAKLAESAIAAQPPLTAIERLTTGYRYVPEPEAESVVLLPHLEASLPLVLAQHRSSRLIAYRVAPSRGNAERIQAFGRALADPKRVEILALVGRGTGRAQELVAATGLSRSTVHHHLALLRDTGLVALEGNARAYTYVARQEAAAEAAELVSELVGKEKD
jgi:DNA-binding transcriptional ArsR family regulator